MRVPEQLHYFLWESQDNMETYLYKCPICGMTHQVPAYWVSFSPEQAVQFPHMRFDTKEICENTELLLEE